MEKNNLEELAKPGVTSVQLDPELMKRIDEEIIREMRPYADFMYDWRARSANSEKYFP